MIRGNSSLKELVRQLVARLETLANEAEADADKATLEVCVCVCVC